MLGSQIIEIYFGASYKRNWQQLFVDKNKHD
jgi:hypothetical protein